ncbi:MAG: tetratricopeptide repeat protein [Proteobacteria bacterium]|nr:tetratricopeptide repeat protein [Pseudomonadota bacterium]
MFKFKINIILILLICLASSHAKSQNIDGLKEIVTSQQEKINTIEDILKELRGSIESQSKSSNSNQVNSVLQNKIDIINDTIKILENKINNITNFTYDLDFALKRIERHLDLSSINVSNNNQIKDSNTEKQPIFKENSKININKKSLNGQTEGVLGFVKDQSVEDNKNKDNLILPKTINLSPEDQYNLALDAALKGDFNKAEKNFKEFLMLYKEDKKQADAQYWLGRVYFTQKKYEEAAIALAEFNSFFPNDKRYQETTLLIAESAVNFAPKQQLCDILNQSLEFMINPSEKFKNRINFLKNEKQCLNE